MVSYSYLKIGQSVERLIVISPAGCTYRYNVSISPGSSFEAISLLRVALGAMPTFFKVAKAVSASQLSNKLKSAFTVSVELFATVNLIVQSWLRTSTIATLYQASSFTTTSVPQMYSIAVSQASISSGTSGSEKTIWISWFERRRT